MLVCPLIFFTFTGCVSRVTERALAEDLVRQEVERLGQEQSQWLLAVNASRENLERILAEKRKQADDRQESGSPIVAVMEIVSMEQDSLAPFRYRGRVRLQQPAAFGREVEALLLSHERNLTTLAGQIIEVATEAAMLERQLEPMGPFSLSGQSTLAADEHDGRFRQVDERRFATEVDLTGRILSYAADPENKIGYFMFDILFSGDVATVLIETPEVYRGTKLRVLVEPDHGNGRASWREVGAAVTFSTAAATVAWEPWGFTRAAELKHVMFPGAVGGESAGGSR